MILDFMLFRAITFRRTGTKCVGGLPLSLALTELCYGEPGVLPLTNGPGTIAGFYPQASASQSYVKVMQIFTQLHITIFIKCVCTFRCPLWARKGKNL